MTRAATQRRPAWQPLLAAVALAGALGWGAGFIWFLHSTTQPMAPPPSHADGIVALTGGAGRVELALHLLAAGHGDRLLVSGIGGNTDLAALAHLARLDVSALEARITLGRYAASTQGNAVETAAWATQNRVRSLIVVTAPWHMPRAMAELRQALPAVRLFPLPAEPSAVDADPNPAEHRVGLRMRAEEYARYLKTRAEEYTKYLLVIAGVSNWLPHREAALNLAARAGASG